MTRNPKTIRQIITGHISDAVETPVYAKELAQAGHNVMEVIASLTIKELKAIKEELNKPGQLTLTTAGTSAIVKNQFSSQQ